MNTRILNREGKLPDDGWYQIEVAGEHFNRAAGVVQLLDDAAFNAIVNRFQAEAAKPNFAGVLIDQDHFSLDPEKSTESFGWLMEVRNRAGQLEGRVEWTDIGEPAVRSKRFKFFSTVYAPQDVEKVGTRKVKNREYPLVRPLALDRLALTNDPNNKGGKPISNRDGKSAGAAETQPDTTMKNLMKALGLAEDASEESAVAAVQAITNRVTTAEGKVTTLTSERDALLTTQVENDLEKYKNRFKPADREKWKKQLIANRGGTIELLESISVQQTPDDAGKRITNRKDALTPEQIEASKQDENERIRGAKISNRASELMAANKRLTRSQAFAKATAEIGAE